MFLFKKEEVTNNLLNEKRAFNKTSIHVSNIMMGFCLCTLFVLKGLTINAQTTPATSNFGCISKYQNVGNWTEEGWQHHGKWYFDGGMNGYITNCNGNNVTIRKWVKQKYNQSPTWWVGEYDMIDVEVTGTMRVYDNSDADWIGFVFGYQGPFGYHSSADSIDGDFLLFDWKQSNEGCCSKEGFSLSRLDGKLPHNLNGTTLRYHYPYLPVYDTIATRYGSTEGWKDYVTNHFKLIYTKTNTTIIINQAGPVSTNPSTNDTIFNVNGTYKPGRFGFYNCSQDNSAYGAVRYRLMKDFEFSDPVICKGGTAELNFLGNDEMNFNYDLIKNMTWIYGDGDIDTISFPDSTTINSTHTYNTAGTYNVMLLIENCSGCIDTAYNTITVTDSEISVINAIDPLCFEDASGSIDITVNDGTAPFQYNWSNGESNEDISNLTAGNYWVTMVDNNGCLDSTNITLTDPALLDLTLSATNETCVGDSDGEIIASPSGGTGSYTYSWTPQNNNSSSLANLTAGSYSLTVEDDNGCTVTKTANLTSYSLPIVTANASQEIICIGEPTQLTGSGADSYTWDNNVTDGDNVSPSVTTTYTVTGTDANTCMNTAQITVTVHALPIVTANASEDTICVGEPTQLTGSGADNYTWDNNVTDGDNVSPSVTTTYTVTGTDANTCMNTAQITVTVHALPIVTANASEDTICVGEPTQLTGSGADNYTWDNNVTDGDNVSPSVTTTYTVTGTDANTCMNTAQITVTVHALPIVTANASEDTICVGEPTQLTGSGADNYTWDNNVTDGDNVSPSVTTTYTVTGTDANTCVNTAQITVTVHNNPIANAGIDGLICPGDDFPITASGGGSYFWPHSGEATATITVSPSVDTWYTVEVTNSFDCENSDSVLIELIVPGFTEAMNDTGTVENIYFIEIDAGQNDLGDLSTIAIISNPANGNCSVNPTNGVITYQPDPGFVGTDTIKYIICDEDCNNSCDEGFIYITVIDEVLLEIPNGFSPNGDGINDELIIEGLYKYPENEITIFNRWGDQVYYAKPYNNDWDGYGNNNSMLIGENKLIDGTYFYYFKYDNEHSVQSGNIELKRK